MDDNNDQLKILFDLSLPKYSSALQGEKSKKKALSSNRITRNLDCSLTTTKPFSSDAAATDDENVPNILEEFANIVDTRLFKQPFSIRKYKHLMPKKKRRKSNKEQTSLSSSIPDNSDLDCIKNDNDTDLKMLDESPCSPSLSIDSAVDLSADHSNLLESPTFHKDLVFDHHYNTNCTILENVSRVSAKPSSHNMHIKALKFNTDTKTRNICSRNKLTKRKNLIDQDELIKVTSKKPRIEDKRGCLSIFDIVNSDLSTPIPIILIKDEQNFHIDKQVQVDISVHDDQVLPLIFIPNNINRHEVQERMLITRDIVNHFDHDFDFNDDIPIIKLEDQKVKHKKLQSINNSTSKDLSCKENQVSITQKSSNSDVPSCEESNETMEIVSYPENIAIRTMQFIVHDDGDDLPANLAKELDIKKSESKDIGKNNALDGVVPQSNFHLILLRTYCAGILQRDFEETSKPKEITTSRSILSAKKVCNKYKKMRLDKRMKNPWTQDSAYSLPISQKESSKRPKFTKRFKSAKVNP